MQAPVPGVACVGGHELFGQRWGSQPLQVHAQERGIVESVQPAERVARGLMVRAKVMALRAIIPVVSVASSGRSSKPDPEAVTAIRSG